jgi:hypothetical protein
LAKSPLSFELEAETACKGLDADIYARVYCMSGRRRIQLLPPPTLVPSREALVAGGGRLREVADRDVLRKHYSDIPSSKIAMIAWYRHCPHPEQGIKQVERIAIHAILHPNADIYPVKPSISPETDDSDIGTLTSTNTAFRDFRAAIYPTLPDEAEAHPITSVLEIPWWEGSFSEGYVALRGIEQIIDVEKLMSR